MSLAIRRRLVQAMVRWPWLVSALILGLVFLAILSPIIDGRLAPIWDADGFFAPYYTLVADYAREGKLLLWNPWTNGGSPDYIEPQVGSTSPVVVISAWLTGGGESGYRVHWLCTWLFGGLGMFAMGRRLGAPAPVAAAIALGFAFSGPYLGNASHFSMLYTLSFLPWALERLDLALERGRRIVALQAGAIWGLSALGGYPGMVLITAGALLVWAVARTFAPDAPLLAENIRAVHWARIRRAATQLGWCFGVGVLVLLPAVLPILIEGRGFTDRSDPLSREWAIGINALHPRALFTIFSPYLANVPPAAAWPYTDISSCSVYVGVVPLVLAVCALVSRPRSTFRWALLAGALLFTGFALGQALPLRGWLYDLVPPTRFFRHASMFRMATVTCVSLLALAGASDLIGDGRRHGLSRWAPLVVSAILASLAITAFRALAPLVPLPTQPAGGVHLWIVWSGIVVILALAPLLRGLSRRMVLLASLGALATYDAHATFSMSLTVASPVYAERWHELDRSRVRTLDLLKSGLPRLAASNDHTGLGPGPTNKNLLTKVPVLFGYAPLSTPLLEKWMRVPALAASAQAAERIYFSPSAVRSEPRGEAFQALAAVAATRGAMPLVVHERSAMARLNARTPVESSLASDFASAPAVIAASTSWKSYTPHELEFEVVAPANGWLLVTDRWARGWQASVDGRETEVSGGNFLFRALPITAGKHRVEMRYKPFGQPWLFTVSWGAILAVVLASGVSFLRLPGIARRRAGIVRS